MTTPIIPVYENLSKSMKSAPNPASSMFSLMPLWNDIFLEFCEATVDVNFCKMTLFFPNKVSTSINHGAAYHQEPPEKIRSMHFPIGDNHLSKNPNGDENELARTAL